MTYAELSIKIGNLDIPPKEYTKQAKSVHFTMRNFSDDFCTAFGNLMDIIENRGGVRGNDYYVCMYADNGFTLALHTVEGWMCGEDISVSCEEKWLK